MPIEISIADLRNTNIQLEEIRASRVRELVHLGPHIAAIAAAHGNTSVLRRRLADGCCLAGLTRKKEESASKGNANRRTYIDGLGAR